VDDLAIGTTWATTLTTVTVGMVGVVSAECLNDELASATAMDTVLPSHG
jgi:hypothetical protein